MELIQTLQQQYIQGFTQSISMVTFLANFLVVAFLTLALQWYYARFGLALSNRRRFSQNFLPLALGTMLIILIVQSSIALSLGLVGALSVVRYRAAIKDPEELTFLFLAIGLGLAGGADQTLLATLFLALLLPILYLLRRRRVGSPSPEKLLISIRTDITSSTPILAHLKEHLDWIDLKRMQTKAGILELDVVAKAQGMEQLEALRVAILALSDQTEIQILEQPQLFG